MFDHAKSIHRRKATTKEDVSNYVGIQVTYAGLSHKKDEINKSINKATSHYGNTGYGVSNQRIQN